MTRGKISLDITGNGVSLFVEKYATICGYVIVFIVFGVSAGPFFEISNIFSVLRQISMLAIIASGLTFVLIVGEFDLSIGLASGLLGIMIAGFLRDGVPIPVAILMTLVLGIVIGAINGGLVVYVGIPAFIGTLAMGSISLGINYAYSDGYPIFEGITDKFRAIAEGMFGGIVPYPVVWMLLLCFIASFYLNNTKRGRYFYAIGENPSAALFSGINVKFSKLLAFMVSGLCVGITAVIMTSRSGSGQPTAGGAFMLDAFAAAFLGTTVVMRGKFHIWGTFFGALFIGTLNNGFTLLNVPYFYQDVFKGVLLLAAVAAFSYQSKKR